MRRDCYIYTLAWHFLTQLNFPILMIPETPDADSLDPVHALVKR